MINKRNIWFYAVLSALLLSLAWFFGLTAFVFIGLVPLLLIENYFSSELDVRRKKLKFTGLTFLTFLLWNLGTTWWIWNASAGGALMAFFSNSILMTIVFVTFSNIKNKINKSWSIWLLIPIWLAWEHIHTTWDLTWPWLTLGNVFSYKTNWVQWYEFTGTSGGTLWILVVNILLFKTLSSASFVFKLTYKPLAVILIPIALSYVLLATHKNTSSLKEQQIVVVQPNIDPYNVKFSTEYFEQFKEMLLQIKGKVTQKTNYLVLPETFITGIEWFGVNEENINSSEEIAWFRDSILLKFPNLNIITGASTYTIYPSEEFVSSTVRRQENGLLVDYFNTGIQINKTSTKLYHKSKLVPGSELMPFPALLKPLESLALDLGGTIGSLGLQKERDVFEGTTGIKVAPVICYESVYSDYCTEYIRKGANFIFVITNDGWWDNTPGHKQHLNYARLRAIETRRCIARSANTGISAFISETGEISQPTAWWVKDVIQATLKPNDAITFFVRFGDIISRISIVLASLCLLYYWFLRFFKTPNKS